MIINSHVHMATDSHFYFYPDYQYPIFRSDMYQNMVDISIVSINPKVALLQCKDDCSYHCPISLANPNRQLQNCSATCVFKAKHRTHVTDNGIFCKTCGKKIFSTSIDPMRNFNIALIEQTRNMRSSIKPLVYLSLSNTTIQNEIDFFETYYRGEFVGYKLHPWTDQRKVSEISVKTKLPFLIHCGIRDLESPEHAIQFAENHPHNVIIIAHAAGIKNDFLEKIAHMGQVYVDCCPSIFLFQHKEECLWDTSITSAKEIYEKVLSYLPSEKILFGSDSPWGNLMEEIEIVKQLPISTLEKENIFYKNAMNVYF